MGGGYFDLKSIEAQKAYTTEEYFYNFLTLGLKLTFMVTLITVNFLALSIALNCNKDSPGGTKLAAAIYSFLFGFMYLFINFYSYRVMTLGKICDFDKDQLFPL